LLGERPVELELTATVYNINPGHNEGMLKKRAILGEYSRFVDKVRKYGKTNPDKKQAFTAAIDDCIKENILREFLTSHSSEVLNMLLSEWKNTKWGEVQREAQ
jgi:hypothetical protein